MDQSINEAVVAVSTAVGGATSAAPAINWSLMTKRCLDLAVSLVVCLFLSPLFLLVVLTLLVVQGRPIFVAHRRVGKGGQRFRCLKFRTMVVDADRALVEHFERCPQAREEWISTRKLRNDPRVTPMGATLRASSVDELPQLINVLLGEMSLVGPRPVVDDELALYGVHVPKYLEVRPGLTGAWQVSGRSNTSFAERVRFDVDYVEHRHMAKDIWILLRTIPAVLLSKGAV